MPTAITYQDVCSFWNVNFDIYLGGELVNDGNVVREAIALYNMLGERGEVLVCFDGVDVLCATFGSQHGKQTRTRA